MRHEFPKSVKVAAWKRSNGHCEVCSAKLFPGRFRYDHDKPDTFGGKPTLENCVVRCDWCDKVKTYKQDIPAIAKSNRIRLKFIDKKKPKGRALAGTKASGIRKRMNGRIERW